MIEARWKRSSAVLAALVVGAAAASAQPPASPVSVTHAVAHEMHQTVALTGTIAARSRSVVASEVAGLVIAAPVREGDRVAANDVVARLRVKTLQLELAAIESQQREVTLRVEQGERRLRRAVDLHDSKVIQLSQLDDTRTDLETLRAQATRLAADHARMSDHLTQSTIRAPFAGTIVARHVEVGEWVAAGAAVIELVSLDDLEVWVDLPDRHYAELRIDQPAKVTIAALSLELVGRVQAVVPTADRQSRTFPVRIAIPNPEGRVGVGMLAEARVPIGDGRSVVIVPKDALIARGPQSFVIVVGDGGAVEQVPVETGDGAGAWIEIRGPIEPGMKLITRGNERVFPGQTVTTELLEYELP